MSTYKETTQGTLTMSTNDWKKTLRWKKNALSKFASYREANTCKTLLQDKETVGEIQAKYMHADYGKSPLFLQFDKYYYS